VALAKLLEKPGARSAVDRGIARYTATKDPLVFEKLVAALSIARGAESHARVAALAADPQYPAELRVKALVALLGAKKSDESVIRAVESLANQPRADAPDQSGIPSDTDVVSAARLVLGGLLHKHRRSPSAYAAGLVASMESALSSGLPAVDRVAYASSLGNAAFPSSASVLASLAAETHPRTVRLAALHALRRMPYDRLVEATLVHALRTNDTTVSDEAGRFLKEVGLVNEVSELQVASPVGNYANGVQGAESSHSFTIITATQELSKSDIHSVAVTEALVYSYSTDGGASTHKLEGSASLTCAVYSASWTFLKVGIYAEKKSGEKSGIYAFVDIMGLNVIKRTLAGGEPAVKDLQESPEADLEALLDTEASTCSSSWSAAIAGDFSYTRSLFDVQKSFWVYVVTIDVRFFGSGQVGLKPGLSVKSCNNPRNQIEEVMITGGLEPYASVTVNLEASINLWLVRGGVGGELKIIDIGLPLYGEKFWTTGDMRGYLDFRYESCSGRLYLFADTKSCGCSWSGCSCKWERRGEITIVSWTGFTGTKNILTLCTLKAGGIVVKGGDGFIEIGDWRFGDVDGTHFSFSHKSGKTAVIFRSDGTIHGGPRTDYGLWGRAGASQATNIKGGDNFIEFKSSWRMQQIDGNHMSLSHRSGKTAMIWRSDGTRHGGPRSDWNNWTVNGCTCNVEQGDKFVRIGSWRIGDVDGTHMSIGHDGQKKTAVIYRSDGTIHPGPRSDYNVFSRAITA
jgi:hypothetical protein